MNTYEYKILFTITFLLVLIVLIQLMKRAIRKFTLLNSIEANRRKVILNLSYLIFYLLTPLIIALIWGVDVKQFGIFIMSILAVLGVGFFAQWSILSNLTASVILFFNHPVRIGDRVKVLDKDFDWSGEVLDITGFYFFMKTDKGEFISLPNTLVIQKGLEILGEKKEVNTSEEEKEVRISD